MECADNASELATSALARIQRADASWEGEVVWCPVITAQVVILNIAIGRKIAPERRRLMLRHFAVTHRPDGGWGLHPESSSYRFVTTLVYVAARLLGLQSDDPMLLRARTFLNREPDGIFSLPQWGKVWLSFIGLFDPRGLNPCPPELFLLPRWLPFSPLRFYCHTRYIYLGMAFLVGSEFRVDLGQIKDDLIRELYGAAAPAQAARHRHDLASSDVYVNPGPLLRLLYDSVYIVGRIIGQLPGIGRLRRKALDRCFSRILFEQRQTQYQGLSPVNAVLNCLALYSREPAGADTIASLRGIETWCWEDEAEAEGIRYAGARSTTWDTSFAIQAILAGGNSLALRHREALTKAYLRLADMQMTSELPPSEHDRDPALGGWCFSDGVHRWPVSDCAAEAIIALLDCHDVYGLIEAGERLPMSRQRAACDFILSRQNADGGFGTYERRRGHGFLEHLNPSEMFGQCMTELSYLECTASSVRALLRLMQVGAARDIAVVTKAVDRGLEIILNQQRPDGSWPGFWGINFIYGTHFALAALHDAANFGKRSPRHDAAVARARLWLEQTQHSDGGWGEHHEGCLTGSYVDNPTSLIISTAWACLGLLHAGAKQSVHVTRGIEYLLRRRTKDGSWPREGVNGVFFGTAMLEYALYNSYFPTMAVNRFASDAHAAN